MRQDPYPFLALAGDPPVSLLYRTAHVRADGAGRTVFGKLAPFGEVVEITEMGRSYQESFERGAFARTIAERGGKVKLLVNHDRGARLPIGRAVELVERVDGLHGSFAVANTRDGDESLELVRSGVVDSFSIGFRPIRDRQRAGVTVRTEVALYEVSLVGFPAYEGAAIAGVRFAHRSVSVDVARRRLDLLLRAW